MWAAPACGRRSAATGSRTRPGENALRDERLGSCSEAERFRALVGLRPLVEVRASGDVRDLFAAIAVRAAVGRG